MDIAFASNVVYPFVKGGAEKRIHEIGKRLAAQGHDITIYSRHFWDGPSEVVHDGMVLRAVSGSRELYAGDRRSIPEAIEYAGRLLVPLRKHIDSHDIVVASAFPYFPIFSARAASLFESTPLMTTWHEVWGDYWDEYLGTLAPFGKAVERLSANVHQHPVAVSQTTADKLTSIRWCDGNIPVVPNGVDADEIRSTSPSDRQYDIVFAGRLIKDKNVDVLLESFDRVAEQYDCTLGIIGDGPEREALERRAAGLVHGDRVTFIGFLDEYTDVLGYLRSARVFAAPSTREGFGITLVEAMAAGCVVVAADHPDSAAREVVDDAGFLSEATVEGISTSLTRAISGERPPVDPAERAVRFDWDNVTAQALDAYRTVL